MDSRNNQLATMKAWVDYVYMVAPRTSKYGIEIKSLHRACIDVYLEKVQYLTKESKNLLHEKEPLVGYTPLHVACGVMQINPKCNKENAWEIIYHLLDEGADLSVKCRHNTSSYELLGEECYDNYHTLRKKFIDFSMIEKLYCLRKLSDTENKQKNQIKSNFDVLPNDTLNIIKKNYIEIALQSIEAQLWRLTYPELKLHYNNEEWNKEIAKIVCLWSKATKEHVSANHIASIKQE
jgi:hypothetical protein